MAQVDPSRQKRPGGVAGTFGEETSLYHQRFGSGGGPFGGGTGAIQLVPKWSIQKDPASIPSVELAREEELKKQLTEDERLDFIFFEEILAEGVVTY